MSDEYNNHSAPKTTHALGNKTVFSSHSPVLDVMRHLRDKDIKFEVCLGRYKNEDEVSYIVSQWVFEDYIKDTWMVSGQESVLVVMFDGRAFVDELGNDGHSEYIGVLLRINDRDNDNTYVPSLECYYGVPKPEATLEYKM